MWLNVKKSEILKVQAESDTEIVCVCACVLLIRDLQGAAVQGHINSVRRHRPITRRSVKREVTENCKETL